eukprot:12915895-Prorocentrum_lima.AAC.1
MERRVARLQMLLKSNRRVGSDIRVCLLERERISRRDGRLSTLIQGGIITHGGIIWLENQCAGSCIQPASLWRE